MTQITLLHLIDQQVRGLMASLDELEKTADREQAVVMQELLAELDQCRETILNQLEETVDVP